MTLILQLLPELIQRLLLGRWKISQITRRRLVVRIRPSRRVFLRRGGIAWCGGGWRWVLGRRCWFCWCHVRHDYTSIIASLMVRCVRGWKGRVRCNYGGDDGITSREPLADGEMESKSLRNRYRLIWSVIICRNVTQSVTNINHRPSLFHRTLWVP